MKFAAAAGLLALVAGAFVLAFQPFTGDKPGSSPDRTVYSFAYALGHSNFGRACSYMADKQRGGQCAAGFVYNAGINMAMFGVDVFKGMRVVPGSRVDKPNGQVVYKVRSKEIPPAKVTVAKQKSSGLWRVVRIG